MAARRSEQELSEAAVRKKYHFSEEAWERLGVDDKLIEAIEAEKVRRIRSGEAKREKAQQHIVKAPDILNTIMSDPKANAKHRIDSAKALDDLAEGGPRAAHDDSDRVIITINLGGDEKLVFNKSVKPLSGDDAKLDDGKLIEHESRPRGVPGFEVD